ncbi:hypothetical protein LEMLEM_LOCUS8658 [Lemmus lemmus]
MDPSTRRHMCRVLHSSTAWHRPALGTGPAQGHWASRQRGGLPCTPYLWGPNFNRGRTIHPRKDGDCVGGNYSSQINALGRDCTPGGRDCYAVSP